MSLTQVQLDEVTLARLDAAARKRFTTREAVINQAIDSYLDSVDEISNYDTWFRRKVERSIMAADEGHVLTSRQIDERAKARLKKFLEARETSA